MIKRIFLVFLIVIFAGQGCSLFKKKEEKSAQQLAEEGLKAFNKKKYSQAIESFKSLKDWYPFDESAIMAEQKIADAHFELEEYPEAITAYEEFENLHPRNEAIPYIIYRIGLCHFVQMDSVDRDQTPAKKALDTFTRLVKQFPDDPHAKKGEENIQKCYKSLVGHEMYVAKFQFKTKKYKGALARFNGVLSDFPDVGFKKEAQSYIPLCEAALKKQPDKETKKKSFTQ